MAIDEATQDEQWTNELDPGSRNSKDVAHNNGCNLDQSSTLIIYLLEPYFRSIDPF
jgi:hypothetical protein